MQSTKCCDQRRFQMPSIVAMVSVIFFLFAFHDRSDAQDFENEPINYATAPVDNAISRLQTGLDDGSSRLEFDDRSGYLASVLRELKIPVSSQVLVFSKTSLQRQRISPRTPRAVYFNDDVYLGYCRDGNVLEVSAVDPGLGTAFYTLNQESNPTPRFVRQNDSCLVCHATTSTRGVPGHIVRSVYSDSSGFPVFSMGTHRTDHSSPIAERWGGWYVTGTHGKQEHLGNLVVPTSRQNDSVDNSAGQNVTDLQSRFDTSAYQSPHSDLISLMVLEHQTEAHNLLTRASFQTRQALFSEAKLNKELGEPEGHRWDSTNTRIKNVSESLVKYLLFCNEAKLTQPISGTTSFAEQFATQGPRDQQGRSLRDFDLQQRMFKYPLSYLVYSRSFEALPNEAKEIVFKRLWEVLTGADRSRDFAHLSDADRTAILEILRDTKTGLPEYWKSEPTSN